MNHASLWRKTALSTCVSPAAFGFVTSFITKIVSLMLNFIFQSMVVIHLQWAKFFVNFVPGFIYFIKEVIDAYYGICLKGISNGTFFFLRIKNTIYKNIFLFSRANKKLLIFFDVLASSWSFSFHFACLAENVQQCLLGIADQNIGCFCCDVSLVNRENSENPDMY